MQQLASGDAIIGELRILRIVWQPWDCEQRRASVALPASMHGLDQQPRGGTQKSCGGTRGKQCPCATPATHQRAGAACGTSLPPALRPASRACGQAGSCWPAVMHSLELTSSCGAGGGGGGQRRRQQAVAQAPSRRGVVLIDAPDCSPDAHDATNSCHRRLCVGVGCTAALGPLALIQLCKMQSQKRSANSLAGHAAPATARVPT